MYTSTNSTNVKMAWLRTMFTAIHSSDLTENHIGREGAHAIQMKNAHYVNMLPVERTA